MRRLVRRWQLTDVARAETLLESECRGQHGTATDQVVLLLKPQDFRNIGWPTAQLKCCTNSNCVMSRPDSLIPNMRLPELH